MSGERVNIGPQAREFRAQGVGVVDPSSYLHMLPKSDEALTYYGEMKPEMYALFSVFIDRVVARSFQGRNTLALVDKLDPRNPFLDLDEKMKALLVAESMDLEVDIESGKEGSASISVKRRLEDLLGRRKFLFPDGENALGVTPAISGGIRTATSTMSGILDIVDTLGRKKTNEEKMMILANTYPFIMRMSSMHITDFLPYISFLQIHAGKSLGYMPLNPSLFSILGESERQKLDLSEAGKKRLLESQEKLDVPYGENSPTVGCPANVNFGEGSAIRNLWGWHMEIAERVWSK